MSHAGRFRRELDELFHRRAHWLRHAVAKRKPTRAPRFSAQQRNKTILGLQQIASDALSHRMARPYFERNVKESKSWMNTRGKGRGWRAKRRNFNAWYDAHFDSRNYVYAFWDGSRCLYVGRSQNGRSRAGSHFRLHWFARATRVDVYTTRGIRSLACMECLAIHWFQPIHNVSKASSKKWTDRCPLCDLHEEIESELKAIF